MSYLIRLLQSLVIFSLCASSALYAAESHYHPIILYNGESNYQITFSNQKTGYSKTLQPHSQQMEPLIATDQMQAWDISVKAHEKTYHFPTIHICPSDLDELRTIGVLVEPGYDQQPTCDLLAWAVDEDGELVGDEAHLEEIPKL